ncbi:MAG: homocysteine S-methyltransferase family protein [Spirochaetota bacterium]
MANAFITLISNEYCVLDGGMGTVLQEKGLSPQELTEEWNLTHPDRVREVHLEYLRAGAQVITTNTFGGSPLKLGMRDLAHRTEELNRAGAGVAREALELYRESAGEDGPRFVAGSVGPSGRMVGMEVQPGEASGSFQRQAEVLAEAGVDLFIVETMMDLNEAAAAVRALKQAAGLPVVASMVFGKTKKGDFRTLFGNGVPDAVQGLEEAGADAVGVNCGLVEEYVQVVSRMREHTDLPLVLYPNAGVPRVREGKTFYEVTPEELITHLDRELEAGATILGGCCGTTPAYISLLAERVKGKKRGA